MKVLTPGVTAISRMVVSGLEVGTTISSGSNVNLWYYSSRTRTWAGAGLTRSGSKANGQAAYAVRVYGIHHLPRYRVQIGFSFGFYLPRGERQEADLARSSLQGYNHVLMAYLCWCGKIITTVRDLAAVASKHARIMAPRMEGPE